MNNDLFEQLLYEEESATLDFKRQQYRFAKASDEEKSELLKDILGFSNAWRRATAYILIGVEEVRGGRSTVVGISDADHLDDHSLQQFVNSLTNRPVQFHYEAFGVEGKQVGVITIPEQERPLYLKRDFGKLRKIDVYVRRGSSTDPTSPASPDEIASMRTGTRSTSAELQVEFANVDRDRSLGVSIPLDAEFCQVPPPETIPDVSETDLESRHRSIRMAAFDFVNSPNEDYLRELAEYEFAQRLFRPVRLAIKNVGCVAAYNVHVEITIPLAGRTFVLKGSDRPDTPRRYVNLVRLPDIPPLAHTIHFEPGQVTIARDDELCRIEINCGHLQPGRCVWSEVFHIGKAFTGDLHLRGFILADNLPQPMSFTLTVSGAVTNTAITVAQLIALAGKSQN
jgi:hypothetical protein